jgi:hypothetical protein
MATHAEAEIDALADAIAEETARLGTAAARVPVTP